MGRYKREATILFKISFKEFVSHDREPFQEAKASVRIGLGEFDYCIDNLHSLSVIIEEK